jgi:hypothetical protein
MEQSGRAVTGLQGYDHKGEGKNGLDRVSMVAEIEQNVRSTYQIQAIGRLIPDHYQALETTIGRLP